MLRISFAIVVLFAAGTIHAQQQWRSLRSLSGGGATNLVRSATGAIYVTSANDVFRSTDDGRSWQSICLALPRFQHESTKILATSDGTLLLSATAERGKSLLYRSTDDGISWSDLTGRFANGFEFRSVALDSASGDVYLSSFSSVQRSTDNGVTWHQVSTVGGNQMVVLDGDVYLNSEIFIIRLDRETNLLPDTIPTPSTGYFRWFTMYGRDIIAHVNARPLGGLVTTSDSGQTWRRLDSGSSTTRVRVGSNGDLYGIGSGLRISTDGGDSWRALSAPDSALFKSDILVTPSGDLVSASTLGIARSSDGGASWSRSDSGFTASRISALVADSHGSLFVAVHGYEAAPDHLWQTASSNNGATWRDIARLPFWHSMYSLATFDEDGGLYIEGYPGLQRSIDLGVTWTRSATINGRGSWSLGFANDTLVAVEAFAAPHYSIDYGVTWHRIPNIDSTLGFGTVAHASDGAVLYSVGDRHLRTTDLGLTWSPTELNATAIRFVAGRNGYVYMIAREGVYRSADGNTSWERIYSGNGRYVLSFAANAKTHMMVVRDSLMRSDDNGITWTASHTGIERQYVTAVAAGADGRFFAATRGGGLFVLEDVAGAVREFSHAQAPLMDAVTNHDEIVLRFACAGVSIAIDVIDPRGDVVHQHVTSGRVSGEHVERIQIGALAAGPYIVRLRCGTSLSHTPILVRR